jgi:hypothetical protein
MLLVHPTLGDADIACALGSTQHSRKRLNGNTDNIVLRLLCS